MDQMETKQQLMEIQQRALQEMVATLQTSIQQVTPISLANVSHCMNLQDVNQSILDTRSQIQDEAASLSAGQTKLQADVAAGLTALTSRQAKQQADLAQLQADVATGLAQLQEVSAALKSIIARLP